MGFGTSSGPVTVRMSPRAGGIIIGSMESPQQAFFHRSIMDDMDAALGGEMTSFDQRPFRPFLKCAPPKRNRAADHCADEKDEDWAARKIQGWYRTSNRNFASMDDDEFSSFPVFQNGGCDMRGNPVYVVNGFAMAVTKARNKLTATVVYNSQHAKDKREKKPRLRAGEEKKKDAKDLLAASKLAWSYQTEVGCVGKMSG